MKHHHLHNPSLLTMPKIKMLHCHPMHHSYFPTQIKIQIKNGNSIFVWWVNGAIYIL